MNKFLIIMTFYGADSYRVRNLKAVVKRANEVWPGTDICLVEQNGNTEVEGIAFHHTVNVSGDLFHKTKLLNTAVALHPDYTHYVMLDADSYIDSGVVDNIVNHCNDAPIIFPYEICVYLNEAQTRMRCNSSINSFQMKYNSNIPITRQTGLVNCFSKATYDAVHGFDEEFIGWGAEDDAFIFKIRRTCGKELRLKGGVVLHLWHKKINDADYLASDGYIRNRCYCSLIRLMNDDEFKSYIDGRTTLAEQKTLLGKKYKLGQWYVIKLNDVESLKIDSSIYFASTDTPSLYDILQEVLYEDGVDYTKFFIKQYIYNYKLSPDVQAECDKFLNDTGISL